MPKKVNHKLFFDGRQKIELGQKKKQERKVRCKYSQIPELVFLRDRCFMFWHFFDSFVQYHTNLLRFFNIFKHFLNSNSGLYYNTRVFVTLQQLLIPGITSLLKLHLWGFECDKFLNLIFCCWKLFPLMFLSTKTVLTSYALYIDLKFFFVSICVKKTVFQSLFAQFFKTIFPILDLVHRRSPEIHFFVMRGAKLKQSLTKSFWVKTV